MQLGSDAWVTSIYRFGAFDLWIMGEQRQDDFKTQELVNIAWAMAKLGQSDTQLH